MKFIIRKYTYLFFFIWMILSLVYCANQPKKNKPDNKTVIKKQAKIQIEVAANQTNLYLPLLKNKNIAVVANQTSVIKSKKGHTHLVDSLLNNNIKIKKVFSPEHGFRGMADAGELVKNDIDTKTGLSIISLYGENKKPTSEQLKNIDLVLFDIQDVGVRFYTYISTLHYIMEACAEQNIPLLVLDRPNPNAHYIDGPVLNLEFKSFVGMHKVPVVYGMTIGEYAKMINGEKWLANNLVCNLTVIPINNYSHNSLYSLPIKPSPNLPNDKAINLYPSLCFFEGTNISCGRGTSTQFQVYGSPYLERTDFSFTPKPNQGAKFPKYNNRLCFGEDLRNTTKLSSINLSWLIKAHKQTIGIKTIFWNNFFTKLAGNTKLQEQIVKGLSEKEIRDSWQKDLNDFKKIRNKYLIYTP